MIGLFIKNRKSVARSTVTEMLQGAESGGHCSLLSGCVRTGQQEAKGTGAGCSPTEMEGTKGSCQPPAQGKCVAEGESFPKAPPSTNRVLGFE